MNEVDEFLFKYVIDNNPQINQKNIKEYTALNNHDLEIIYHDGVKEIFDTFSNTCRRISNTNKPKNDKQLKMNFKRRLQILLNRSWISQAELAKRIGTSQQMISKYLSGESTPNSITLKKISRELNCSMDDFYE